MEFIFKINIISILNPGQMLQCGGDSFSYSLISTAYGGENSCVLS